MRYIRFTAAVLAACLLSVPACAQSVLNGSLIPARSADAGPVAPRVLYSGIHGERYAALPNLEYLVLPPEGSALAQPSVERTSAGTYRYSYTPAEGEAGAADRAVAAVIESFEAADGGTSVKVRLAQGAKTVFGEYDQKAAKRLFVLVNQARRDAALPALSWDPDLADAARLRAAELSVRPSHARPDGTQYDTVSSAAAAENYLYGFETADLAAARMLELPGRKENILREKHITVGAAAFTTDQCTYWVLVFGK